tara:strand:- start:6 stop:152 length:147 start_codon:yes stop_codon:yes gene_type:complete
MTAGKAGNAIETSASSRTLKDLSGSKCTVEINSDLAIKHAEKGSIEDI